MPAGRRNAKSNTFKHHPHLLDDRHTCEMPTQPQVVPPKHIPMPDFPNPSDFFFEMEAFGMCFVVMLGQYLNLYRSVFWLPYSHTDMGMNMYLIDTSVLTINLIMVGRRVPVCILNQMCYFCLPTSYHSTCGLCSQVLTAILLTPIFLYCCYNVVLDHGYISILFLIYPFVIYFFANGTNPHRFLELKFIGSSRGQNVRGRTTSNGRSSSSISHSCSMSAETIREEVEMLIYDCNDRFRQLIFNSFLVMYHTAFLPCYFTQPELHFDVNWVTQYGILITVSCFNLYITYLFPPKYCDILHRAAIHLGRWQKVDLKNVHVPSSIWTESTLWNQGALVKYSKELFKAEGISNAAEPGHTGHYRFYKIFQNPSYATGAVFMLHICLLSSEMLILLHCSSWNDLFSLQLLIMPNCRILFTITKVFLVVKKIYYEEQILISKTNN